MVNDVGHLDTLADQFFALGVQLVNVACLKREVIEDSGDAEAPVDAVFEVVG